MRSSEARARAAVQEGSPSIREARPDWGRRRHPGAPRRRATRTPNREEDFAIASVKIARPAGAVEKLDLCEETSVHRDLVDVGRPFRLWLFAKLAVEDEILAFLA